MHGFALRVILLPETSVLLLGAKKQLPGAM